ncbi:MAG: signal peptidase II [Tissierellia bacterium]|nr:signal peptidase II [Tissierellia bacterium]
MKLHYFIMALAIVLDQISKIKMVQILSLKDPIVIIPDFFKLTLVHNKGAAFGILQNQRVLFLIITVVADAAMVGGLVFYGKKLNRWERWALGAITGGAIGNAIDRIRFGYVVDFFSFTFFKKYNFAVFNVADAFIVVGVIVLLMLTLWGGKSNDK